MVETSGQPEQSSLRIRRAENFRSVYSHHVFYNTTVFDLTMMFGQYTQVAQGDTILEEHTQVTMSWLEAKIAALYLLTNIAIHEAAHGTIRIPPNVKPSFISQELAMQPIQSVLLPLRDQLQKDIQAILEQVEASTQKPESK